jgi:energy-coupling factor transporter ATP-binding protein EcfA2
MSRDALVVGLNTYQNAGLRKLQAPAEDAEAIAQLLETYGDFKVTRLPEAIDMETEKPYVGKTTPVTLKRLKEAIIKLFNPEGRNIPDTALLFFSGHGVRKSKGIQEGFLATSDASPNIGFNGLSLQWLRRLLQESPIKQQIIWLDCCHSGELMNFAEANPGEQGKARDRCFIAASREFEVAYEELGSPYSVLTQVLREGLDPKRCPQRWVTNISLTDYLNQHLQWATQTPLFTNFGEPINLTRLTSGEFFSQILATVSSGICPYKGLRYFDFNEEDPKYFYGREQLTDQLLDKVRQSNFLAIVGASGSGKSSVVRAGLLHQLKQGRKLAGSSNWKIQIFVPTEHPMQSLALTFLDSNLSQVERAKQLKQAKELLAEGAEGLKLLIEASDAPRVVVVIDQFEEVFTLCQDGDERQQFLECLLSAVEKAQGKLCLILAMRADFFDKLIEMAQDEQLTGWQRLLDATALSQGLQPALTPDNSVYAVHLLRYRSDLAREREIVPRGEIATIPASGEPEVRQARLNLRLKRPLVTLSAIAQPGEDGGYWLLPERVLPFLRAGASAVVAPWWETAEPSDRLFWTHFYQLFRQRLPLGEAVWRSRLAVRRAFPHSADWLAYTLFGDPCARAYEPEPSEGYAAVECLNPDEPLRQGKTYYFRASLRSRPPVWYTDRLIQPEELPQQLQALFMAPGLQATFPKPLAMQPAGHTMRQVTIELTSTAPGNYPLLVQLLEGDELVKTLQLNLEVRG